MKTIKELREESLSQFNALGWTHRERLILERMIDYAQPFAAMQAAAERPYMIGEVCERARLQLVDLVVADVEEKEPSQNLQFAAAVRILSHALLQASAKSAEPLLTAHDLQQVLQFLGEVPR